MVIIMVISFRNLIDWNAKFCSVWYADSSSCATRRKAIGMETKHIRWLLVLVLWLWDIHTRHFYTRLLTNIIINNNTRRHHNTNTLIIITTRWSKRSKTPCCPSGSTTSTAWTPALLPSSSLPTAAMSSRTHLAPWMTMITIWPWRESKSCLIWILKKNQLIRYRFYYALSFNNNFCF